MVSKKLNIVAIIPARFSSTRLPAKPLVDLCGKPMIQHVVEQTRQARSINRVIVATDDERIASVVHQFGAEAIMTPTTIRSGSDRIAYAARSLTDVGIIVNVQGDEPLIVPQMIDQAVRPLVEDESIQVGTLVKRISSSDELINPNTVKVVIDEKGYGVYFSRAPIPYLRDSIEMNKWHERYLYYKHIGLYVFRKDFLLQFASWEESTLEKVEKLEQLRIIEHGYKIKTAVTEYDSVPVDTPEDAERVRTIVKQRITIHAV